MERSDRLTVVRAATRLCVFVAEPHGHRERLAVTALMERAAALGVSGGTVLAGLPVPGHHAATPLVAIFVDLPERLAPLRAAVDELLSGALVVADDVTSIRYIRAHRHAPDRS